MLNLLTVHNLSIQAQHLLHQRFGFRTDQQSEDTTNVTSFNILNHEINELGNTDIPDTLNKFYQTNFKPKDGQYNIQNIYDFIAKNLLHIKPDLNFHLLWLASTWQPVIELYSDGFLTDPQSPWDHNPDYEIPQIDMYFINPKTDYIISDLGYEGQLIASPNAIKFINAFNY